MKGNQQQTAPELLAPAGNTERLRIALAYGADAVYIGGRNFGLRAFADNFSTEEMAEAVSYVHDRGKKVYVTMNVFPRNEDFEGMAEYAKSLERLGADAVIVSDPGVLALVREAAPSLSIHLSTQANCTNWRSALFWHGLGVSRIILARELSLSEIRTIRERTPHTLALEVFVHGAVCMAYSGRCAISAYLTGRDANRGECSQPCRWEYHLAEAKRPGAFMPVAEDEGGAYLFNSKDLCMIEHIPALMEAGLSSFKIEGRMKTAYYTAIAVGAYRREMDRYLQGPEAYVFERESLQELKKASHRPYTTGFFFGRPESEGLEQQSGAYLRGYDFVGLVTGFDSSRNLLQVEQRNAFGVGDTLEVLEPGTGFFAYPVTEMYDADYQPLRWAPHPQQTVYLPYPQPLQPFSLLRRPKNE